MVNLKLPLALTQKVSIRSYILFTVGSIAALLIICLSFIALYFYNGTQKASDIEKQLADTKQALTILQNEDQIKVNVALRKEIEEINRTYKKAQSSYEAITDLDSQKGKTEPFKAKLAKVLNFLSERNYASAEADLRVLDSDIQKEKSRIASLSTPSSTVAINVESLPASNTPPGAGYSRQAVSALGSTYIVDIVAADMASTRIIVDTATDGDCRDSCPVLSLGDYVARNGAFAGVNGSYFCPADYPSCAGKSNSFDTLAMNRNKKYINSDNNVYSTVPAVIFQSGSMRFVGASQEWGRDTGVDGVLANQPLLLSGNNVVFGGSGDPKQGSKGSRSFVGNRGSTAYIGVVRNVTVAEMAHVLKALGLDGALNLDSGGSTALWSGGYKAGPGRNIPNAILFIRK